jgi:hypothetical protein
MSLGTAVLILGVLCLLVFGAGFRRFALWGSVGIAAVVALIVLATWVQTEIEEKKAKEARCRTSVAVQERLAARKGNMMLPPGVTRKNFQATVDRMVNDVKQWNTPERCYWYENGGRDILTSVGNDPEIADRVTATVAKTSQTTPVLANAAFTTKGHNQAMLGVPVRTGKFPNVMSPWPRTSVVSGQAELGPLQPV